MGASQSRLSLRDVVRGFPKVVPGRPGDPGLFGPASMVWRLSGEAVSILGGGRALLMQIAHPMVAAGVADHSDFGTDAFARLWSTLDAVLTVVFGDTGQARAAAERVARVHERVVGRRGASAYRALDADLLLWVHATLVDTALVSYERFVGPLTRTVRETYYFEMKRFASAFGLTEADLPPDLEAFEDYLDSALLQMEVSAEGRSLAAGILRPPAPALLRPLSSLTSFITVGLLPSQLREGFGLTWSPARERLFSVTTASIRGVRRLLPRSWCLWPQARQAEGRSVANVR